MMYCSSDVENFGLISDRFLTPVFLHVQFLQLRNDADIRSAVEALNWTAVINSIVQNCKEPQKYESTEKYDIHVY